MKLKHPSKCPYCKVIGLLVKIGPSRYQCRACGRTVRED